MTFYLVLAIIAVGMLANFAFVQYLEHRDHRHNR